jgi:hypothetical protein
VRRSLRSRPSPASAMRRAAPLGRTICVPPTARHDLDSETV